MSEPTSDALFGVNGTAWPDPLGHADWGDVPGFPPLPLPAIPNLTMTREAIAAALDADAAKLADHDPGPPTVRLPNAPPARATPAPITSAHLIAPRQPNTGRSSAGSPGRAARPFSSASTAPVPPMSGESRSPVFRPSLAFGSRTPVRLGDLRRRISRHAPRATLPARSDGGAAIFFLVAAIVCVVLAWSIIVGIVGSITRLFQ